MATLIQLVRDLARQSGTLAGGSSLATVSGVSGRAEKLVNWIIDAWSDIQAQRQWLWLYAEFSNALLANTARYTAASFNLARFGRWGEDTCSIRVMTLYDPAIGKSDEQGIRQIAYDVWKLRYGRGAHDANRPTEWAISPMGEVCFGPTPDKAYVLNGEYWKAPQVLAADGDMPEAPGQHHKIIIARALQLMAESDESIPTLQLADREYARMFSAMSNDPACLPAMSMQAGALA